MCHLSPVEGRSQPPSLPSYFRNMEALAPPQSLCQCCLSGRTVPLRWRARLTVTALSSKRQVKKTTQPLPRRAQEVSRWHTHCKVQSIRPGQTAVLPAQLDRSHISKQSVSAYLIQANMVMASNGLQIFFPKPVGSCLILLDIC